MQRNSNSFFICTICYSLLKLYLKPSVSLVEINSWKTNCKHESISSNCIKGRIFFLCCCCNWTYLIFSESTQNSVCKDGHKGYDDYHWANSSSQGLILRFLTKSEGCRMSKKITSFNKLLHSLANHYVFGKINFTNKVL